MIYKRDGSYYEENQHGSGFLGFLYGRGKHMRSPFTGKAFSKLAAWVNSRYYRKNRLAQWIQAQGVDLSKFQGAPYEEFQDFFTRKYKPRVLEKPRADWVISPSDGKVSCHAIDKDLRLQVKGETYRLADLLANEALARAFAGGWLYRIRLSVTDCHRFLYPESGDFLGRPFTSLAGNLDTVSDYSRGCAILKGNHRCYSILDSRVGPVLLMEVGALMVGRIKYHKVDKGRRLRERGLFLPGGSTILLAYAKGRIKPDEDILEQTALGNEVAVTMAERIGSYVT